MIYTVTSFEKLPNQYLDIGSSRCFGYYKTFEQADEAVKENRCDLHECLYLYSVIEEIEEGIHSINENRWFYKFDLEKQLFFAIDEPDELRSLINLSIG